jgi:hypothetical protein
MKIDDTNPLRKAGARPGRQAKETVGDGFARQLAGLTQDAKGPSGAPAPAPLGSLDALLAVQAAGDTLAERKRARQRAAEILDRLDALRQFMLLGGIPRERLEQLARLVREQRPDVDDPRLAALLDEIDLRAQVELAKLEAGR